MSSDSDIAIIIDFSCSGASKLKLIIEGERLYAPLGPMAVEEPEIKISETIDGTTTTLVKTEVVTNMPGFRDKEWAMPSSRVTVDLTKLRGGHDSMICLQLIDGPSLTYGMVETSVAALLQKPKLFLSPDGKANPTPENLRGIVVVRSADLE